MKRYSTLRTIGTIAKWLAAMFFPLGILYVASISTRPFFGLETFIILLFAVSTLSIFVFSIGGAVHVLMDIEQNTRRIADVIDRNHSAKPSQLKRLE